MPTPLTADQLRRAALRLPRVALAHLPTPLEEVPRFAARLKGPRVFIKRDDHTGMVMGGNKTRHNEFLFGAALQRRRPPRPPGCQGSGRLHPHRRHAGAVRLSR